MSKRTALAALALFASAAFISACGIATAPYSVPDAVAQNTNYNLSGPVVDETGKPLDGVLLSQKLDHHFWTPLAGGTETDENKLRRVDHQYEVNERGASLTLTFTHDGYYDSTYNLYAADSYIHGDFVVWPNTKPFPVVMLSRAHPQAKLVQNDEDIDYSDYPRQKMLYVRRTSRTGTSATHSAEEAANLPAGLFYLTVDKQPPAAIDSKGDVNPVDVNLPEKITLHITGPDTGFIPIQPQLGYSPLQTTDTAPTSGYQPEITIDRARLKQMRTAFNKIDAMNGIEYFFFTADGCYGKGSICWQYTYGKNDKTISPISFYINLLTQPEKGNTDLTLRSDHIDCDCPK